MYYVQDLFTKEQVNKHNINDMQLDVDGNQVMLDRQSFEACIKALGKLMSLEELAGSAGVSVQQAAKFIMDCSNDDLPLIEYRSVAGSLNWNRNRFKNRFNKASNKLSLSYNDKPIRFTQIQNTSILNFILTYRGIEILRGRSVLLD